MNVWILSVRELARLLRGRLTWLAAALTVLSPLAGLTVYRSASADTMQSLYVANPALAGGVLGGLFFALLTLCDCARTSRCRVEVLCDAAVSPLTAALARLMAYLASDGPARDGGADPGPHPSDLAALDGPYRGRRL